MSDSDRLDRLEREWLAVCAEIYRFKVIGAVRDGIYRIYRVAGIGAALARSACSPDAAIRCTREVGDLALAARSGFVLGGRAFG